MVIQMETSRFNKLVQDMKKVVFTIHCCGKEYKYYLSQQRIEQAEYFAHSSGMNYARHNNWVDALHSIQYSLEADIPICKKVGRKWLLKGIKAGFKNSWKEGLDAMLDIRLGKKSNKLEEWQGRNLRRLIHESMAREIGRTRGGALFKNKKSMKKMTVSKAAEWAYNKIERQRLLGGTGFELIKSKKYLEQTYNEWPEHSASEFSAMQEKLAEMQGVTGDKRKV